MGSGYGFNGSEEEAIKLLDEKITDVAKYYADKAFVAGRSKTPWRIFYLTHFLSTNSEEEIQDKLIEIGLLCDGKEYCKCAKEAMKRYASIEICNSYERNCPNKPH